MGRKSRARKPAGWSRARVEKGSRRSVLRKWLGVILGLGAGVLILSGVWSRPPAPGRDEAEHGHAHPPGPHGGVLVEIGQENRFHAEVVFEKNGIAHLFTFGDDDARVEPIDSQVLAAV